MEKSGRDFHLTSSSKDHFTIPALCKATTGYDWHGDLAHADVFRGGPHDDCFTSFANIRSITIARLEQDAEAGVEDVPEVITGNQWLEMTRMRILAESETLALSVRMEFIRGRGSSIREGISAVSECGKVWPVPFYPKNCTVNLSATIIECLSMLIIQVWAGYSWLAVPSSGVVR
jgi:hypothetical protein